MSNTGDSALFKSMFDYATVGIVMVNTTGEIIKINPFANDIFGYSDNELIGQKIEVLIPDHARERHVGYRKGYTDQPVPRPMGIGRELAGLHKDGSTFPVEISLSFAIEKDQRVAIAFVSDTSVREEILSSLRQSEKQLQEYSDRLEQKVIERTYKIAESEAKLREAQRMASLGYWEFDLTNKKLITSDVLREIFGLHDNEDVDEDAFLALIHPEDSNMAQDVVQKVIQRGHRREYSYRILTPDGALKYIQGYLEREKDPAKSCVKIFGITQDVTAQKASEVKLAQALTKERELGELKSRFVSMASHEFRTPLTSIMSSTDIIGIHAERLGVNKFDRHLNRIKAQVDNLTSILNDFLSLEKLESGTLDFEPVPTNIPELLRLVVDETVTVKEERARILLSHEGIATANIDPKLIRNILVNLLSNAVKYSPKGGTIDIRSHCNGKQFGMEVEDHGIGIPIQDQQAMFQRFFRASNAESIKGTGLGLNIVKRYLDIMDGTIFFNSEEGKGTTFVVDVPVG